MLGVRRPRTLPKNLRARESELSILSAGTDPGEVKWVNFHPPFSEAPSFFFFSYPSNIDLKHLNQALVLLHYYKNSPPISKSWIRA